MSYSLQFGWVQAVLLAVFLVGGGLLVSMLVGRRKQTGEQKRRWRPRLKHGFGGAVMVSIATFLTWITTLIQGYLGLTGEVKAAHVVASKIENAPGRLNVELTLYGEDHTSVASRKTYQLEGDRWALQANIVELEPLANTLGLRGGYKITRLDGQFEDGHHPSKDAVILNDDRDFFKEMQDRTWWTKPFVRSAYGSVVVSNPGDYDVFISRDAITARSAAR
ncbi:conserved hypothetical protein [Segniliparus rotundus DSM 44985]|uniref:Uncharacterized protein n=1 Tax=Segniliparus rotundus (strain ATCC BAA-972 / CDC 1076 / CIP 108378 / DSM 44985 / JCM 13578) TaxID=640132 RepID=D6Z989_SEGRD|nr:hypothetical protein [Segniliparus rotundus]ADG98519.1 conserved hypothetical protein [Segniliparus rotundus DSM 44985]